MVDLAGLRDWSKRARAIPLPERASGNQNHYPERLSRIVCSGALNDYTKWRYRSCRVSNVRYDGRDGSWSQACSSSAAGSAGEQHLQAHAKDHTDIIAHLVSALFDADFGAVPIADGFRSSGLASEAMEMQDARWPARAPWVMMRECAGEGQRASHDPPSSVPVVQRPVQLWYPNQHLFWDCNIGHLLFDWGAGCMIAGGAVGYHMRSASASSASRKTSATSGNDGLLSLRAGANNIADNENDDPAVVLMEAFPFNALQHPACRRIIPVAQPSSTTTAMSGLLELTGKQGDGRPPRHIHFKDVLVGSKSFHIQHDTREPFFNLHNLGREAAFMRYRNSVLSRAGINPLRTPSSHSVLLLRKGASFAENRAKRAIQNIDEAAEWISSALPSLAAANAIQVADLSAFEWQEQLRILMNTSLLVTPCGGASTILPFLPIGATAIITDYPSPYPTSDAIPVHLHGGFYSVSMEGQLWSHFPHVRILYYQMVDEITDWIITDEDGEVDYRQDTAPVLQRARLLHLLSQV